MKKIFLIIGLCVLILSGCVTTDPKVALLEQRIDKVEQQVKIAMAGGAAASFRPFRLLTGNTTGSLDSLSAASISLKDVAFVATDEDSAYGNAFFVYTYTDHGAAVSDNPPYEIKPDVGSPNANHAWTLAFSSVAVPKLLTGAATLTIGEARAGIAHQTAAGQIDLPKASTVGYGTTWCVFVADASETCVVNPNTADIIVLHGTVTAAGDSISSPGNEGDFICMVSTADVFDGSNTDGWITLGYGEAAWTDTN